MLTWILLALIVYYAGVFLPSLFLIPRIGLGAYLASRDGDPDPGVVHARAKRATSNLQENLAPFLALAILSFVVPDTDQALAVLGAQVFVLGRLAFVPLYLLAVPLARSVAYTAGFVGLIMMALALV